MNRVGMGMMVWDEHRGHVWDEWVGIMILWDEKSKVR